MADLERITVDDIRKAGHCPAGIRRWFEARGLDFRGFVKDGMSLADFAAIGDGQADAVIAHVQARRERRHG